MLDIRKGSPWRSCRVFLVFGILLEGLCSIGRMYWRAFADLPFFFSGIRLAVDSKRYTKGDGFLFIKKERSCWSFLCTFESSLQKLTYFLPIENRLDEDILPSLCLPMAACNRKFLDALQICGLARSWFDNITTFRLEGKNVRPACYIFLGCWSIWRSKDNVWHILTKEQVLSYLLTNRLMYSFHIGSDGWRPQILTSQWKDQVKRSQFSLSFRRSTSLELWQWPSRGYGNSHCQEFQTWQDIKDDVMSRWFLASLCFRLVLVVLFFIFLFQCIRYDICQHTYTMSMFTLLYTSI